MKITIDRSGDITHTTIEREPMPPERFEAIVKLVGLAIGGAVLLGATKPQPFVMLWTAHRHPPLPI